MQNKSSVYQILLLSRLSNLDSVNVGVGLLRTFICFKVVHFYWSVL